jgi:hypothetical protein
VSVLPHVRREAGSDALSGDAVIGGADRGLVFVLAWLAHKHRKDATVEIDKRMGIAGRRMSGGKVKVELDTLAIPPNELESHHN